MKYKSKILYKKIQSLNLDGFKIENAQKKIVKDSIRKNARFLGTEFERAFKKIISQLYGFEGNNHKIWIEKNIFSDEINIHTYPSRPIEINKDFCIDKFLEEYNFQKDFQYGIDSLDEIFDCQEYVIGILKNINYEQFRPKKFIYSNVKLKTDFEKTACMDFGGEIDLIIDDKIIDIKTDLVLKLDKKYICQLLHYYFFVLFSTEPFRDSNSILGKIEINKICLYYANFDFLLEIDIKDIFKSDKVLQEIDSLIHNELLLQNNCIKKIIEAAIFRNKDENVFFLKIENNIYEGVINSYKRYIVRAFMICQDEKKRSELYVQISFSLRKKLTNKFLSKKQYEIIDDYLKDCFRNGIKFLALHHSEEIISYNKETSLYFDSKESKKKLQTNKL